MSRLVTCLVDFSSLLISTWDNSVWIELSVKIVVSIILMGGDLLRRHILNDILILEVGPVVSSLGVGSKAARVHLVSILMDDN